MKRLLLILPLLLTWCAVAGAQPTPIISTLLDPASPPPGGNATLRVTVDVPPGYHAQSNKPLTANLIPFSITTQAGGGLSAGAPQYPAGGLQVYAATEPASVYTGQVVTSIPIQVSRDAKPDQFTLSVSVTYQICDDEGRCLPPRTEQLAILGKSPAATPGGSSVTAQPTASTSTSASTTVGLFGVSVNLDNWLIAFPVGLIVGLLFNVMPCVLPILPLKAMSFYEISQHRRGRTFALGLMFSLGLIALFMGLAMFVILSRSLLGAQFQWGQWFSIGWFIWGMTILLILLGLGMLGAFSVRLPSTLYALEFRHDTLPGNFLWGMLTAVLSTPCTAPMFAGLIGWAIGQNVFIGATVMLSVGVGMSLPYLVLSGFPELARRFPRAGPASELVKQAMAFPLFATAAWLVGPRVVGDPNHYWLVVAVAVWGALFVLIRAAQILKTSTGVLATTALSTLIVGACVWLAIEMNHKLDWQPYSAEALADARASGRPVVVKFTASWCANCQWIEHTVYTRADTLDALRQRKVILIKADLTQSDAPGWKQLNELGQTGIPLTAIYTPGAAQPRLFDSIYSSTDLLNALPATITAVSSAPSDDIR